MDWEAGEQHHGKGAGAPGPWPIGSESALPWQPGGSTMSWGAPGPAGPGLLCSGLTSSPWGSSGHHNIKKTPIREDPKEAMRMGKDLEGKPYEITWFVQLEKRRL